MSERQKFEKAMAETYCPTIPDRNRFDMCGGRYEAYSVEFAWQAWQSARESEGGKAAPSVPEFPDIGCGGDCGFIKAGIGYQCRDGEACGSYLHPGDDGYAEVKAYYESVATPKSATPQPDKRIPEGWKLVPVNSTINQRKAAWDAHVCSSEDADAVYAAMLDAAPTPPEQESE